LGCPCIAEATPTGNIGIDEPGTAHKIARHSTRIRNKAYMTGLLAENARLAL
jgi:hypothetical protein